MNNYCDRRRRGHQRLTCSSRSSGGAGCPVMLTNAAAGAGRLVISLALFLVSSVTGEIRCFCNQPACVSTSYMCKSHIGMCFLQTTQDGDTTRTVHACAETLSEDQRYACAAIEDDVTSTQKIIPDDVTRLDLICCRTDMCNYKPRLFINIYISRMNGTSVTESLIGEGDANSGGVVSRWSASNGQLQLWFRVAVIVVPSIGAVLLAVIVYAAVRMLRNDALLRHNSKKKTRLRHRSSVEQRRQGNDGCHGSEDPLLTKPFCIMLSAVNPAGGRPPSQWRPLQRVCPEEAYGDKPSVWLKDLEVPLQGSMHVGITSESCTVYWEYPVVVDERCRCGCHVCACELYSKSVVEHEQNRSNIRSSGSNGTDLYSARTSLRTAERDKTGGNARNERTARQDELENKELQLDGSAELL